jgi:hypothetical protein
MKKSRVNFPDFLKIFWRNVARVCGDSIFSYGPHKTFKFFFLFFYFIYSKNSGRPQGKLVRRHKVLKSGHETKDEDGRGGRDDESPDKYWHWKDLNVASDVDIFGRRFRLTNCNQWTRVNKKRKTEKCVKNSNN